jgi:hypothetical protein
MNFIFNLNAFSWKAMQSFIAAHTTRHVTKLQRFRDEHVTGIHSPRNAAALNRPEVQLVSIDRFGTLHALFKSRALS